MTAEQVVPNVYRIPVGEVNVYLLEHDDGLTLLDTGEPGNEEMIVAAVRSVGKTPKDIRHIVVTHCHPDHSGSLAALKRVTGAPAYMHPADAALVREGSAARSVRPAPGLKHHLIFYLVMAPRYLLTAARNDGGMIEATEIEHEIQDGETLDIAGGLQAIHAPGHCAGQLAFLWNQQGGVLFGADVARDEFDYPSVFEDVEEGKRSLEKVAELDFEVACFGHGRPIRENAAHIARRKVGKG